jgi:hypothetical protein
MPSPLLFYGLSVLLTALSAAADPSSGSALYPPGLQPLIIRANALLSAGTFHDAAKVYSEAIGTFTLTKVSTAARGRMRWQYWYAL